MTLQILRKKECWEPSIRKGSIPETCSVYLDPQSCTSPPYYIPSFIMSAVNRSIRTATRTLKLQQGTLRASGVVATNLSAVPRIAYIAATSPQSAPLAQSHFHTSAIARSGAPAMSSNNDYDPEIKDIANYVHNYNIDSDLAVSSSKTQKIK